MANPFARAVQEISRGARSRDTKGVASSQIVPVYRDNHPNFNEWRPDKAIKDGFKASSWVFACVSRLMQAASAVGWAVYGKSGSDWKEIPDHPLAALLDAPNPFMSRE